MEFEFEHVNGDRDDHKVRLLTLSNCGHCKQAKKLMNELGISYDFVDVDKCNREEKREITKFLRERDLPLSFPIIMIDEEIITGYRAKKIHELLD